MGLAAMLSNPFTPLDFALADFLTERCGFAGEAKTSFNNLVRALSSAQSSGHSCLELSNEDQSLLEKCRLVYCATARLNQPPNLADTPKPLVIEGSRLYLNRYWRYETRLVKNVLGRASYQFACVENEALLDKYFPVNASDSDVDWQRQAAKAASEQALTIITGGPGTGKTSTVLKVLALLQELNNGELAISLAAPTGKAAMRLQQSLLEGKRSLALGDALLASIPEKVSTLHRLLGPINQSNQFRHNEQHPLNCDVLVIDESSMIDLAMMSKLLDALAPSARLILLGDKDQLASVESGAVLNDLCTSLPRQTIELKKTWRFSGAIKDLAAAINSQQAEQSWLLLNEQSIRPGDSLPHQLTIKPATVTPSVIKSDQQISLFDVPDVSDTSQPIISTEVTAMTRSETSINLLKEDWLDQAYQQYQGYIKQVKADNNPHAALAAFSRFQVLCAVRQGEFGVEGVNWALEKRLYSSSKQTHLPWYHGKPVMITRNDPSLGLFNGDIGICLNDDTSQLRVWFNDSKGHFRAVMPARLPQYETVYAMTIHKSQGSEFEHVMIVLPDKPLPILSSELLYTGVTRAKKHVDIASGELVFNYTVNQQVIRNSGIPAKIRASQISHSE